MDTIPMKVIEVLTQDGMWITAVKVNDHMAYDQKRLFELRREDNQYRVGAILLDCPQAENVLRGEAGPRIALSPEDVLRLIREQTTINARRYRVTAVDVTSALEAEGYTSIGQCESYDEVQSILGLCFEMGISVTTCVWTDPLNGDAIHADHGTKVFVMQLQ
jgi:hypothetical protein